ncbi:MAG: ornithine carbamoyltransferase subunit F [Solirubrobacteraceae bacterium]
MTIDLQGRQALTAGDLSREEIVQLLDLAAELKAAKLEGREQPSLSGRNIALIFEGEPTGARDAFEMAAHDQGATVTPVDASLVHRAETLKDAAQLLGRRYDAIEYRGFDDSVARQLGESAEVPVYQGLTGECHLSQILGDFLTFDERLAKPLDDVVFCYLGDARLSPADEYLVGGGKLGMDVRVAGPRPFWPGQAFAEPAHRTARRSGGHMTITEDVAAGVRGCDVLLTDLWIPPGTPADAWQERIDLLSSYQVNRRLMALTGNPAVRFMHARPALPSSDHERDREIRDRYGRDAQEVSEEVLESPASLVREQAENRMHAIKAVLVATLG